MKRRTLIQYAGGGLAAAAATIGLSQTQQAQAQTSNAVTIQALGHTCFLFTGGGLRILVNPFRPIGCTKGYRPPRVPADLVMISSRLFDEGSLEGLPGSPRLLAEPGIYEYRGVQIQGVRSPHDRQGGRRFGFNVIWRWNQGGLILAHMGGAAAPIEVEQQILIGRPDVLFVPVGGGPKAYNATEARQAVLGLNPRIIVPTHFRTAAADANACDISPVDEFLALMEGVPVRRPGDTITLRRSELPSEGSRIELLSYRF
jgi:L-ascorbate metabolism protein UlaG (beta-lactamase superfamily)